MKSRHLLFALACALGVTTLLPAQQAGDGGKEPLVEQVKKSIDLGVIYLKKKQNDDGSWEEYVQTANFKGGTTAIAVLALLNAGVPTDDPVIKKGLIHLRKFKDSTTYVRALQTLAYIEAGNAADRKHIQYNVDRFLKSAVRDKRDNLQGWNYGPGNPGAADNSNTHYAVLALRAAKQSGVDIDRKFWEEVRDFYLHGQSQDGGWSYTHDNGGAFAAGSTLTMTTAGVCGLLMAQMALNDFGQDQDPVATCGLYKDTLAVQKGLDYIGQNFRPDLPGRTFYNLYGIERLGRLSGMRFLGPHDWYGEGCAYLVKKQTKEGSWDGPDNWDNMKIVSTSFALSFLSRGRTPVLISKLAHGSLPRQANDQDWTRRRNDLRHLVDFASKQVFKKMPLAWQNFDLARTPLTTAVQLNEATSELLQSPIVYITGHDNPNERLKESEKAILKKYVANGGFILAVACCGAPKFDKGFRDLCRDLFDKELEPLEKDHAVWNMVFDVAPGSFKLEGLQLGCKTVVIYAPENLCGYWELNRHDDKGEGAKAFRLGANIVAYATGRQAPPPRLTKMPVAADGKDEQQPRHRRGYFKIAQLLGSQDNADKAKWTPAPQAMNQLARHLYEDGLNVSLKTDRVPIDHQKVLGYKFLYLHGRHDFKFTAAELKLLRLNLHNGGLLLADACCGTAAFDKAFRQFIADLFPQEAFPKVAAKDLPRLEPIPFNDPLFGKKLNGEPLSEANIQLRSEKSQAVKASKPQLEGVKINKRWVVIYSKYDIGCALERHQSADCLGYSYDSAMRLARAAVLYQFALAR